MCDRTRGREEEGGDDVDRIAQPMIQLQEFASFKKKYYGLAYVISEMNVYINIKIKRKKYMYKNKLLKIVAAFY